MGNVMGNVVYKIVYSVKIYSIYSVILMYNAKVIEKCSWGFMEGEENGCEIYKFGNKYTKLQLIMWIQIDTSA